MNKRQRVKYFIRHFLKNMPDAKTELKYNNVFELTVAVILSAQCTDKRVNMVTPSLFKKFPNPKKMSLASIDEIFNLIKSCSYPSNKAKYLYKMSRILVEEFNSHVPSDFESLQRLPGVGRKTANVISSVYFDIPSMPVDTHVFRVSRRIGLTTNAKTPLVAEHQLVKIIPTKYLNISHHWLILHGRYTCKARRPLCNTCSITNFCKYFQQH